MLVHNKAMKNVYKLPDDYKPIKNWDEVTRRLKEYHGIDPKLASERLHAIKEGITGNPDVIFDKTGGVYHANTRELLGYLTEGGAKAIK